jgi:hypothetical protein
LFFEDFSFNEELLGMICLKGRITGQEIFNFFYYFVTKSNVPLHKFVSIITEAEKSMKGHVNGFIAL